MKITLVRHGTTELNQKGYFQGSSVNYTLSPSGREYAEKVGQVFDASKYDVVISSPLLRAQETAEILDQQQHELVLDDRLQEQDFGEIDGKSGAALKAEHPDAFDFRGLAGENLAQYVAGAETYAELNVRIADFVKDLEANYHDQNVLIVCHGVIIRALAANFFNSQIKNFDQVRNVSLSKFYLDEADNFAASLISYNETII